MPVKTQKATSLMFMARASIISIASYNLKKDVKMKQLAILSLLLVAGCTITLETPVLATKEDPIIVIDGRECVRLESIQNGNSFYCAEWKDVE